MKGFLRIRKAPKGLHFSDNNDDKNIDFYLSRLIKLIPSDILALYVFGENLIPEEIMTARVIFAIICLMLVAVSRYQWTKEINSNEPQWPVIVISMISFCIWVYSIGSLFEIAGLQEKWLGSLMIATWVVIVPYIYHGDEIEN
jgi:amino acid transporter